MFDDSLTKKAKSGKLSSDLKSELSVDERPVPEGYVCRICQEPGVGFLDPMEM